MQAFFHIRREQIRRFHIERYQGLGNGNRLHFHSHIEILLINRGEAKVWINDTVERLCAGELAVVPSYATHQFIAPRDTVDCTILFIPTFLCPGFMEAVSSKHALHPLIRVPEAFEKVQNAVSELERKDLNPIEQTGYIHVILGTLLRYVTFAEGGPEGNTDLPARLLLYINEHFKEEISVDRIAKEMGYSRNYIAESFRASFHVGISRYINTVRLKNALSLMRENKGNITDCAMESGFSSLRTFYRVFTEELGCTPREYLKTE